MSNQGPENHIPQHSAEESFLATVKGTIVDNWRSPKGKLATSLIGGGAVAAIAFGMVRCSAVSTAEELSGAENLNPTYETSDTIEPEPSTEETYNVDPTEPANDNPVFFESNGQDCSSSISTAVDGLVQIAIQPTDNSLEATGVFYPTPETAVIVESTDFNGQEVIAQGSDFELYALETGATVLDKEVFCGAFSLIDYDDRGMPVFESIVAIPDDQATEEPSPTPSETEAPAPASDPFRFEGVEVNGNFYNCSVEDNKVEIYSTGDDIPQGYKLAVYALYTDPNNSGPAIYYPNSRGEVELPEGRVSDVTAILVENGTAEGIQQSYTDGTYKEQYNQMLEEDPELFEQLYGLYKDDLGGSPAGICNKN